MPIADDETFVLLMRLAREDREFGRVLRMILSRESAHRKVLLGTLLQDMKNRGTPEKVVRAVSYLWEDGVAARALALLEEEK